MRKEFRALSDEMSPTWFYGDLIYEGDILDSNPNEYHNDDPCPYIIIYHDGSYKGKRINGLTENALAISESRLKVCNDVIIGNIHQNQDLLKH